MISKYTLFYQINNIPNIYNRLFIKLINNLLINYSILIYLKKFANQ